MARIYKEPIFNNQFRSFAESGKFVAEKSFDPSKQIREEAKRKAENIKSLQRSQQRQAAVNDGYFRAQVAEGNAQFAKTKALLSFAQSGLSTIAKLDEIKQNEQAKQEGLDFLKPELGGSIIDDENNDKLEDIHDYENDVQNSNVDLTKESKKISEGNVKIEEEIIGDSANTQASISSTQITTYTAAASLEADLDAFLRSDTKIQLADGTIIVAKDATVDQLPAVIDVGLHHVTKSYFPHELSGKTLYDTYIPTAKRVYASLLNKHNQEKIALAQELRVLEHTDLATVQLDEGQPASFVLNNLKKNLYTTGAYKSENEAFEASFEHLSNYYRSNQDLDGAADLLNVYKIVNKDGSVNTGSKLANDPVYSIKIMNLMQQINDDKKNIQSATIAGIEKDMFEELGAETDISKRRDIVLSYINKLKDGGYYQAADKLAGQIETLQIPDSMNIEDANIYQQVVMGEITSKEVLDEQLKLGVISKKGYDKALEELDNKNPVIPDGGVKNFTDDISKGYLDEFKIRIGAEVNPNGEILFATSAGYLDNASDYARISAALELDLKKVALTTYKLYKDQGQGTVIAKIDEALKDYFKLQVTSEGGKYYVKPYANDNSVFVSDGTKKLKKILSSSENLTRAYGNKESSFKPVRFAYNGGDSITLEDIATFNPNRGDTIFSKDVHEVFVKKYVEDGTFDEAIIDMAEKVNMTPLQFLNSQSTNHGLGQIYRPITELSKNKPNYIASTEYLLNNGLSNKSAKILTGNILENSSWTNIGTNNSVLNFDTTFEVRDLDAILEDLKVDPAKYRVCLNPYATDRQLLDVARSLSIFK
jgi:hypothetical protein